MYFRWDVSNFIVFLVAGLTVTFLLSVVLIEKFTCVPKRLSRVIVQLTGNKMLHQMMAITNVLTLLSCVLLPLVIFHFRFHHLLRSVFRSKKRPFCYMYHFTIMISFTYFGVTLYLTTFWGIYIWMEFFESIKNWKIAFLCAQENPYLFLERRRTEPFAVHSWKNFGDVGREPKLFFPCCSTTSSRKSFSFKKISSFVHLWH